MSDGKETRRKIDQFLNDLTIFLGEDISRIIGTKKGGAKNKREVARGHAIGSGKGLNGEKKAEKKGNGVAMDDGKLLEDFLICFVFDVFIVLLGGGIKLIPGISGSTENRIQCKSKQGLRQILKELLEQRGN